MLLFGIIAIFSFCCTPSNATTDHGLLRGFTGMYNGNCMPAPDQPPCEPEAKSLVILITQPTEVYSESMMVMRIQSKDDGTFEQKLPVGKYSLFLLDENEPYCAVMECPDQCFCQPIEIVKGEPTDIRLILNKATW